MRLSSSRPASTAFAVEDLPIPEDHAAPYAPVITLAEGHLEAGHPHRALITHCLGRGKFVGALREEELVAAASNASPFAEYLVHPHSSQVVLAANEKAAGVGNSAASKGLALMSVSLESRPPVGGAEPAGSANNPPHTRARVSWLEQGTIGEMQHVVHWRTS
jgi:hypothetical protein